MSELPIYHFDQTTGHFLGTGIADKNPLDRDNPLIPAGATTIAPPEKRAGFLRIFSGGVWGYVSETAPDADPTPEPVPTEADYSNAIQAMMDAKARERQYDGIQSAITYRGDGNARFAAEAEALFAWRSAVWTYATAQLAAVMAGSRTQPTVADFVDEVQTKCPFSWPVTA